MADEELENQEADGTPQTLTPDMPGDAALQLADGTGTGLAQDSENQADAIDPYGQATIHFDSGNHAQLSQFGEKVNAKLLLLNQTFLPLIVKALIELLGNSQAFKYESCIGNWITNNDNVNLSIKTQFICDLWVGIDIAKEYIMQDAQYILNTVKVIPGISVTQCEIDVSTGSLSVAAIL